MGRHVVYFGLMLEMFAGWMLEMGMVEAVVYSDDKEEEAAAAVEACVEPCCNMFLERPVYQVSIKTSGVSYYLSKLLAQFLEILGTRNRPNTMTIEPNRTRWPASTQMLSTTSGALLVFYQRFDAAPAACCFVWSSSEKTL